MSQAGGTVDNSEVVERDDGSAPEDSAGRLVAAVIMLAVPVIAIAMAFDFSAEARRVPLVVGVTFALVASGNLIREFIGWKRSKARSVADQAASGGARSTRLEAASPYLWLLGFWLGWELLGFFVGYMVFAIVFLRWKARFGWVRVVGVTIGGVLLLYGIAYLVPAFRFPIGILGEILT